MPSITTMPSRFLQKYSPLTRVMLLLAAVNSIINITFLFTSAQTSSWTLAFMFFRFIAYNDSWELMNHAMEYLHTPAIQQMFNNRTVYDVIFFGQQVKFQYPLTSLIFLEPLRLALGSVRVPNQMLNTISWFVALAAMVVNIRIFRDVILRRRENFQGTWSRQDITGLVCAAMLIVTYCLVLESYILGQIQTWIDFLFGLAVFAWARNKKSFSGICIGLICIMKPNFVLFFLWGALRKQWRFLATLTGTVSLFTVLSIAVYGWANTVAYFSVLDFIARHGESIYSNQSVNGLLSRALFNGPNLGWEEHRFAPYNAIVYYSTLVSSIGLAALGIWKRKAGPGVSGELLDLSLAALCFVMASPIVWAHHYGILLPVFLYLFPAALAGSDSDSQYLRKGIWLCGLSFVLLSNRFDFINILADTHFNVLQSYKFFAGLLLIAYLTSKVYRFTTPPQEPNVNEITDR
jgi:alpha-1,2-mannosyltransferase